MDLLISPKLVSSYINNASKIGKTEEEKLTMLLFENSNNKFIVNKKILTHYENEFSSESSELDKYRLEFVKIIQDRIINKSSDKDDLIEILEETHDKYINEKTDSETYLNLATDATCGLNNRFTGLLNNVVNKKSKDYLYYNLAAHNPNAITYRFYDFANDREVEKLFNCLFDLKTENHNYVDIFDRNINLTHTFYSKIRRSVSRINYYTLAKRDIVLRSDDFRTINAHFNSVFVFRGKADYLHERRVMFNTIIIECDDDFGNISIGRPTWKIDISVCRIIKMNMDSKKKYFPRDYTR